MESTLAFTTELLMTTPICSLARRAAICYTQASRTQEKMSAPATPAVPTRCFDTNQIKCDIAGRYFIQWRQRDIAPHQLLFAPSYTCFTSDSAHDLPARHVFARQLQVHKMTAQVNDRHGSHGGAKENEHKFELTRWPSAKTHFLRFCSGFQEWFINSS